MTVGWFNLKVYAFDVIGFDYVFAFKPEIYGAFSRLKKKATAEWLVATI